MFIYLIGQDRYFYFYLSSTLYIYMIYSFTILNNIRMFFFVFFGGGGCCFCLFVVVVVFFFFFFFLFFFKLTASSLV